jgi:hypothetical protein
MAGRMASHLRSFRNARSPSAAATIVPSGVERGGKTPAAFLPIPRPGSPYTPTPEAVRAAVAQTRWGNNAVLGWQPQGTPPAIRVRPHALDRAPVSVVGRTHLTMV